MRDYYIFKFGRIRRKDNSIFFEYEENGAVQKKPIPVNDVDSIYCFGEIDINSKLLNFFSQNKIIIHFFNYYGYYSGTFYPREFLNSGDVLVRQASHYTSRKKRLAIAREFARGACYGTLRNLQRYKEQTGEVIARIEEYELLIDKQSGISGVMGIEGNVKESYYRAFPLIIKQKIDFPKRVKRPPNNMMNALISFVNGVLYSQVLKEIYRTQLNPTISYLHTPGYRRFSLALDVAEIFKPIYGDRVIFALLNNRELEPKHFDKDLNRAYLNEEGRKITVKAIEDKLGTTIMHKTLKRKVSYRRIIRLELYKLIKHILGEKDYKSFKIWW